MRALGWVVLFMSGCEVCASLARFGSGNPWPRTKEATAGEEVARLVFNAGVALWAAWAMGH